MNLVQVVVLVVAPVSGSIDSWVRLRRQRRSCGWGVVVVEAVLGSCLG